MQQQGHSGSHFKIQYFILIAGLVLGIALPRAYATGDNSSARIAQLESRVGTLTSKVQALENKTTFVRRSGDRMEINAPNLHLTNTALVLTGQRGSLTVQDANVLFGKNLEVVGNALVRSNTQLGDAGGDTVGVSGSSTFAGNVDMQNKLKVKNEVQVTDGDMYLNFGKLYAYSGVFSTLGDITTLSGNIVATIGNIRTINGSIIANVGNIRADSGNLFAGGSITVNGSAFLGDGIDSDALLFNGPSLTMTNLNEVNFSYAGGSRKFRITDANLLLYNSDGILSTNGLGNFIIGDGEVGLFKTFGVAPFQSVTNSLIMGYDHRFLNAAVQGAIVAGNSHFAEGYSPMLLGGYGNRVTEYGFALGGNRNVAGATGGGMVGGFQNTYISGAGDAWHAGVGDSEFNPN